MTSEDIKKILLYYGIDPYTSKSARYEAFSILSERELYVLHKRACRKKTLSDVGVDLKLTRQRIHMIEKHALQKLTKRFTLLV